MILVLLFKSSAITELSNEIFITCKNKFYFQDEEFSDMVKSAERIDFLYGHFFDEEIVNDQLLTAFEKLVNCVQRSENEPLWAPAAWVQ